MLVRPVIKFGPFEFDPAAGLLYQGEEETLLPPKAAGVLHVLLGTPTQLVTKDELLERVWAGAFVTESSLTDAISLLRQVLGDDSRDPTYIQTLHRRGYRFIAAVVPALSEDGSDGLVEAVEGVDVPAFEPTGEAGGRCEGGWAAGDRLGNYEILDTLGAGVMGTVYRARDESLEREVAIKALPPDFADDPERVARLAREAKLLASVSHPNIAAIHSLEEADGIRFPVFELVEGETLERRLRSGRLPVDEALDLGRQIASALEAAHEQGIIHRDLKPANIKVTPEGQVKVLDFGLAKALEVKVFGAAPNTLPTESIAVRGSRRGSIVGTAAYMSPEQARGQEVDKRADIWSFGSVLYELLTGRRPFEGETVSDTIVGVLEREPGWAALPSETPALVRSLLRRLLQKDPANRLHDIADARIEIEEALSAPAGESPGVEAMVARSPLWRRAMPWGAGVVVGAIVASLTFWSLMRPTTMAPQPPICVSIELPPDVRLTNTGRPAVAISPNGTHLVFSANHQLYVRAMDDLVIVPLRGADGDLTSPFFSPDGQWVGFWGEGELRKIPISGGAAARLCNADNPHGASWGDGQIVYGQGSRGIWRVSAEGGEPEQLIVLGAGEQAHGPQMLPGGEWVLYTLRSGSTDWDDGQIVVQSLATDERKLLVPAGRDARYLPSGHIVYALDDVLLGRSFDLSRLEAAGSGTPVAQGVWRAGLTGGAHFSASLQGILAYIPTGQPDENALVWVDRSGTGRPVTDQLRWYHAPRLSPDGKRVAVGIFTEGLQHLDIWILEIDQNILERLTTEGTQNWYPTWTPDGMRVTFASDRGGTNELYWKRADFRDQEADPLLASDNEIYPAAWSRDGRTLVLRENVRGGGGGMNLLVLPFDDNGTPGTPWPFLATEFRQRSAMLSPDGSWLAYVSDRSGQDEVYVKPFPGPGRRHQLSDQGGIEPLWGPDGREVFYREGDKMVAVTVETEPSFEIVAREALFENASYSRNTFRTSYDIHPDGQRFLMLEELHSQESGQQINIVLNWFEELKRRVPRGQ